MFGMNRTMSKMAEIGTFAFIKQTLVHGSSWNLVILYIYISSFLIPNIKGIGWSTIDLWPFNDLRLENRDFPDLSFEQFQSDLHETRSEYVSTDYLTNRQLSAESTTEPLSYNRKSGNFGIIYRKEGCSYCIQFLPPIETGLDVKLPPMSVLQQAYRSSRFKLNFCICMWYNYSSSMQN